MICYMLMMMMMMVGRTLRQIFFSVVVVFVLKQTIKKTGQKNFFFLRYPKRKQWTRKKFIIFNSLSFPLSDSFIHYRWLLAEFFYSLFFVCRRRRHRLLFVITRPCLDSIKEWVKENENSEFLSLSLMMILCFCLCVCVWLIMFPFFRCQNDYDGVWIN